MYGALVASNRFVLQRWWCSLRVCCVCMLSVSVVSVCVVLLNVWICVHDSVYVGRWFAVSQHCQHLETTYVDAISFSAMFEIMIAGFWCCLLFGFLADWRRLHRTKCRRLGARHCGT